jgi:hypothetical protein
MVQCKYRGLGLEIPSSLHPLHVTTKPIVASCWNHRSFTFQKVGLINQQLPHILINKEGLVRERICSPWCYSHPSVPV